MLLKKWLTAYSPKAGNGIGNAYQLRGKALFIFIFFLSGILLSVGLFNYLIDPYGRYGVDILNMHRIDARTYIVNKLSQQIVPLRLLLFGSSRCLALKPKNYLKNQRGLNVALYGGAIEDHYCILRYAVDDLHYPVRFAVLGLDPDLLVSSHSVNEMLKKNAELSKYLIENKKDTIQSFFRPPGYVDEIASLLSLVTMKDSCRVLFQFILKNFRVREAGAAEEQPDENGLTGMLLQEIVKEKDSIRARLRQYEKLYFGSVGIDPGRLRYLYRFADFAQQHDIKVLVFIPGYGKMFWEEMNGNSAFNKVQAAVGLEVVKLREKYGWESLDFRPGKWHGPALEFFDGIHPTKRSARLIDKAIQKALLNGF